MKMSNNPVILYEVLIKQYLRSILDISGALNTASLTPIIVGTVTIVYNILLPS